MLVVQMRPPQFPLDVFWGLICAVIALAAFAMGQQQELQAQRPASEQVLGTHIGTTAIFCTGPYHNLRMIQSSRTVKMARVRAYGNSYSSLTRRDSESSLTQRHQEPGLATGQALLGISDSFQGPISAHPHLGVLPGPSPGHMAESKANNLV